MARAATSTELTKLRSAQRSILYMLIHVPRTVYTARVNQAVFDGQSMQVIYDGGSGTLANVKPGMTVYVGSIAGGHDLGMVRVRKTPSATVLYYGETSAIAWADDLYLTVVDEFSLWQKPLRIDGSTALMDWDVAYTDQHNTLDPVPVMGGERVLALVSGTISTQYNWVSSWVLGSTIASYACAVTGPAAASIDNSASATPTITFSAAGWYTIALTVTAANGKSATGYRLVYVRAAGVWPDTAFELGGPISMDVDSGGCKFSVRMFAGADLASVRERAKVILFTRDWYGENEGSIGPLTGCENILASGWISNEQLTWNANDNSVAFQVEGPAYWLNKQQSYPVWLEYSASAPAAWTSMLGGTVDRGLWHLLHWRSTATLCMDVILTGETQYSPVMEAPLGTVWNQLKTMSNQTLLAEPRCDRYGRLFVELDVQITPADDRESIPTVMALTQDDFDEEVFIERITTPVSAQVEASGVYFDGISAIPLSSLAPGASYGHFGVPSVYDYLLVESQTRLNELSGQLLARENNEFPAMDLRLAAHNRMIDVCPRQRLTLSMSEADTVRGLVWTNKRFIPRRIEYSYDAVGGYLLTSMTCEAETTGTPGITQVLDTDTPRSNDVLSAYQLTDIGSLLPSGLAWTPAYLRGGDEPPSSGCRGTLSAPGNGPFQVRPDQLFLTTQEADKLSTLMYMPCMVRALGASANTRLRIVGNLEYLSNGVWVRSFSTSAWVAYAVDGNGAPVLTALNNTFVGYDDRDSWFKPASQLDVSGFKIELPEPGTEVPGAYNRLFDFSDGWQGWVYEGNTIPANVRWNNGRLEKRRGRTYWKWYPDELYAATGAVVECDHGPTSFGPFAGFGVGIVNTEEPLSVSWVYTNARNYGHPSLTLASGYNGKRICYVMFDEGEDNFDTFGCWIDNVQLSGFTNKITARRLNIQKVELYNICGVE